MEIKTIKNEDGTERLVFYVDVPPGDAEKFVARIKAVFAEKKNEQPPLFSLTFSATHLIFMAR